MMKEIVAVLGPDSDWLTIADIAAKVYDTEEPSHIQRSAVARSARMLADRDHTLRDGSHVEYRHVGLRLQPGGGLITGLEVRRTLLGV
jgi:hypothetical protein